VSVRESCRQQGAESQVELKSGVIGEVEMGYRVLLYNRVTRGVPGYAAKLPRVQSIRTLESLVCDTLTTEGL
jgi:hypothetical protein